MTELTDSDFKNHIDNVVSNEVKHRKRNLSGVGAVIGGSIGGAYGSNKKNSLVGAGVGSVLGAGLGYLGGRAAVKNSKTEVKTYKELYDNSDNLSKKNMRSKFAPDHSSYDKSSKTYLGHIRNVIENEFRD